MLLRAGVLVAICATGESASVPAGFENLSGPQQGAIDVFHQDRYVATVAATYTTESISFDHPQLLLDELTGVTSIEKLTVPLATEFPANSHLICANDSQTECGVLQPQVVGLIFDEANFRADLFIHPELLGAAEQGEARFLEPSSAGLAMLQNVSVAFSGDTVGEGAYGVFGRTVLSFGEHSLRAAWDVSDATDVRLNSAYWHRDRNGLQLTGGMFLADSPILSFSSGQKMLGLRFGSSLKTRIDTDRLHSSRIELFLNNRARVDIFREQRLIGTGTYAPGNQLIDTTSLPSGAYQIEIRVSEDSGRTSTTSRYFVKAPSLPSRGHTEYFVELGRALDEAAAMPQDAGQWLARAGVRYRLSDTLGLDLATASSGRESLLQAGVTAFMENARGSVGLMGSDAGDLGYTVNAFRSFGQASLSLDLRTLDRAQEPPLRTSDRPSAPPELLGNSFEQYQLGLGFALGRGNVALRSTYLESADQSEQLQHSLVFSRYIGDSFLASWQVGVNSTAAEESTNALFSVQYVHNSRNGWTHQLRPSFTADKLGDESETQQASLELSSARRWDDVMAGDLRVSARASAGKLFGDSVGLRADYESLRGRLSSNVSSTFGGAQDVVSYTAVATTGILTDFNSIAWGGRTQSDSAVMIDIDSELSDVNFTVLVDEVPYEVVRTGQTGVVPLSPYNTYEIRVRPDTQRFVGMSEKTEKITLYPGNVVKLSWVANEIVIGYGQIVDAGGAPVANAIVEGALGSSYTDRAGIFQAELDLDTSALQVRANGERCTVSIPDQYKLRNGVAFFGVLVCR